MRASGAKFLRVLIVCAVVIVSGLSVSASDLPRDERLDQKVSYTGGYTRLHNVVEELSKSTKVSIRCGRSKDDWRVRDVPVIVFVKDLPLDKLLQTLADATHTQLFRKDPTSGPPIYNIYRNAAAEKELMNPLDAKVRANVALANWAWDVLTALADSPDVSKPSEQGKGGNGGADVNMRQSKLVGKVLKSLGPEAKGRVFSGDEFVVSSDAPGCKPVIKDLMTDVAATNRSIAGSSRAFEGTMVTPTDADVQSAQMKVIQDLESGAVRIYLSSVPVMFQGSNSRITITWWADSVTLADFASSSGVSGLPVKPIVDPDAKPQEHYPSGMVVLEKAEDWTHPALQQRVEMKQPERKHLTREDLLRVLHKSSGINIVCEDFACHRWGSDAWPEADFGTTPTVASVIKAVNVPVQREGLWFFNENAKLLVGWAGKWREHHVALVPESLISGLRKKIRGNGADLDDLSPLASLSREQRREWVNGTLEFAAVDLPGYTCFWRLYEKLGRDERYQAKSTDGLKLSGFDPVWLWDLISSSLRYDTNGHTTRLTLELNSTDRIEVSGPSDLSNLVMRVVKEPLKSWSSACMVDGELVLAGEVDTGNSQNVRCSYKLEILNGGDHKVVFQSSWGKTAFPVQFTKRKRGADGRLNVIQEWEEGE